ncbi:MAG: hypothetical protein LUD54_07070, partial [Oscillospiraceae bacterium]|nr:hypothetical protein [Oscillospiraceae bacterium]
TVRSFRMKRNDVAYVILIILYLPFPVNLFNCNIPRIAPEIKFCVHFQNSFFLERKRILTEKRGTATMRGGAARRHLACEKSECSSQKTQAAQNASPMSGFCVLVLPLNRAS